MIGANNYDQPRVWWDPLVVVGVGGLVYGLLSLWALPCLHPSVWDEVLVAAGVRPPANPFPGLYRFLAEMLFNIFPADRALNLLPHLGRASIALASMLVYQVFRDMLPATLRIKTHIARIGAHVGRLGAFTGTVLFACADPVWRAGQTFSPVSVFLLLTAASVSLFFRFLRKGSIPALYACCALVGVISAESTLGFLMAFLVAFGVMAAVRRANDPDVPLVNPLVDALVRDVVFKRLTYVWAFFFLLTVGLNVWRFVAQDGLTATGHSGILGLLFEYFRGGYEATRGAANGSGWLFILLLALAPFILSIKMLPRAWDDDKFLPWLVGVVYAVAGAVAFSQLAGARALWFWTWLGERRDMVSSDTLLAFVLIFDIAAAVFALTVFGVDAVCRNYHRIARQNYPESVLEPGPAQMAESLRRSRVFRKRAFWMVVCALPCLVIPGRFLSAERDVARLINVLTEETLRETEGCEMIFTDGSFDELLELEAFRRGRSLVCLSLMAGNNPRTHMLRMRAAADDEDRELFQTDAASALRSWVAAKPARLAKSAVQIGFELWRRANLSFPPCSGVVALPGGVAAEERTRALEACEKIGNEAYDLAKSGQTENMADRALGRKFPFVLWRLSRLAHIRSRAADEAGNREEAYLEARKSEELDSVNTKLQEIMRAMNWIKQQNGGQLSPREGLVIGLSRADFAYAGRFAAPVLKADPDDPRANFALGMMYYQEKMYSRAEEHLARCLKRRPDEPAVLNNLAIVQIKLGKLDEAEANAQRAAAKHPELDEVKNTLMRIQKAKAEKAAEKKRKAASSAQ